MNRFVNPAAATSRSARRGIDSAFADVTTYVDRVTSWEDDALARLSPSQREVTWGDYWVGFAPVPSGDFLFGRVATADECAERERVSAATPEELADSIAALWKAHRRGYRLGHVYSPTQPDGDFETVHLHNALHRISPDEFAVAQSYGWDVGAMRRAQVVELAPVGVELRFCVPPPAPRQN
jgi:hypothetical protein